jgi:hypothetical protein
MAETTFKIELERLDSFKAPRGSVLLAFGLPFWPGLEPSPCVGFAKGIIAKGGSEWRRLRAGHDLASGTG